MNPPDSRPGDGPPAAPLRVLIGLGALIAVGAIAFVVLSPGAGSPPADVAGDLLLQAGRDLFRGRCISCHGESGRGDGPIARSLTGPPPGDLTDDRWIHGDRPEQVLEVISYGVPKTSMSGWANTYGPDEIRALAAYVYHLAGRPVPGPIRRPPTTPRPLREENGA